MPDTKSKDSIVTICCKYLNTSFPRCGNFCTFAAKHLILRAAKSVLLNVFVPRLEPPNIWSSQTPVFSVDILCCAL